MCQLEQVLEAYSRDGMSSVDFAAIDPFLPSQCSPLLVAAGLPKPVDIAAAAESSLSSTASFCDKDRYSSIHSFHSATIV
jgi:hypothetical protein